MIHFLRYTINRLGQYSFLIGVIGMIGTLVIVGLDLPFYLRAVEVGAKVERIDVQCTLEWRTVGSGGKSKTMESDRMECGKARAIKAGDPMAGYKLVEHKRSYLSYVAPDGAALSDWTAITHFEGREIRPGDRVTVMIDPDEPGVVRPVRGLGDLAWWGGAFGIFFGMTFLGWIFEGLARNARLPFSSGAGRARRPV